MDIRKILDIVTEAEKPLASGMKVMSPAEFLQSQGIEPKNSEEGVSEDNDTIYKNWRKDLGTDYDTTLKLVDKDYNPNKPRNVADELAKMNKKLKSVAEGSSEPYDSIDINKWHLVKDNRLVAINFDSEYNAKSWLRGHHFNNPDIRLKHGTELVRNPYLKYNPNVIDYNDVSAEIDRKVGKESVLEASSSRNSHDDYDLDSHTSFIPKGRISDLDFDLRHISHAQNFGALQDALDGQFGPDTRKWLENQMMEISQEHGLDYDDDKEQIIEILMSQLVEKYGLAEDLDEAEKLKGVSQRPFPKDELIKYLDRVVGEPVLDKEGKPKLDKKGNPQFKSLKTKTDKYKFPYIHRSNVPIVNQDGQKYDLDKLASLFTERPSKILKQNEKMQHSDGTASQFYNVGLPALIGLAVDEDSKEFVVINTCPGAGNCKLVCYAMKGGYIQYPASNLSQTRLLNFLYNDPEGFMGMLESEIAEFAAKNSKKNIKTIIRWHDAGDFFSSEYLDKAYNLAKKFPDVDFYAYTKLASVAQGDKPDNFKINFSMGAQPSQEKKIDFAKTKNSRIVPEVIFADLLEKDKAGKWQYKNPQAEQAVKDRIAAKYSLDPKSIITYDEMMKIPVGKEKGKWNVIVKPGDGDDAANRNDVLSSLLLIH